MAEIQPEPLVYPFNINYDVIKRQVDGLSHQDSLLQPPFRGGCLNWILGYILIAFMYFHETYHTGQTELLRQLAGTDDKVI
jgi:hypothetical protein